MALRAHCTRLEQTVGTCHRVTARGTAWHSATHFAALQHPMEALLGRPHLASGTGFCGMASHASVATSCCNGAQANWKICTYGRLCQEPCGLSHRADVNMTTTHLAAQYRSALPTEQRLLRCLARLARNVLKLIAPMLVGPVPRACAEEAAQAACLPSS